MGSVGEERFMGFVSIYRLLFMENAYFVGFVWILLNLCLLLIKADVSLYVELL